MKIIDFTKEKNKKATEKETDVGSESNDEVISRLKSSLKMAEDDNIINCAVILIGKDGSVADCWGNGNYPFTIIGALESLKSEFMSATIEHVSRTDNE